MADRPAIPKRLEKALFQEAASRCPVCGENDVSTLMIHHIKPFAENPVHDRENMIVLCANCHARADRGEISKDQLYATKERLAKIIAFPRQTTSAPSQTVIGDSNIVAGRDIQVENLHIRQPRTSSKGRATVIPGTVATDPFKLGYLKYLARRYNEFKEREVGKQAMRYPAIYKAYQGAIKYGIEQTPLKLFEIACRYLRSRIDNTKLGRIRKKQGQRLYSTFEEFIQSDEG